ncbi:hypothetical protein MTQ01_09025 [Streptomyces sp. XM4193]|uniref:hypothetical protein n=1 Tax=Streptomyces sp. XM4193 TaxID=2929782 RepID=UPI001FFB46EE|nr:hypothetical protein [Streptomyces sp. XM4193]MCK1796145.1 hypothetical protein [Streptomyces sp. XM4193]
MKDLLEALDNAWDIETGFLGKLREGKFDPADGEAYVKLLATIPPLGDVANTQLVRLIWFSPTFIEWQIDRATDEITGGEPLRRIQNQVHEEVIRIIGLP